MITKLGKKFTDLFQKYMPDAFVFALILTLITAVAAYFWVGASPISIIQAWYKGFWMLLEFGMQMVLLVITGYSIALSPLLKRGINQLTRFIKTPLQVYFFIILIGGLLTMISWGWIVISTILARELASRVKGIHYPYLIACVYFSFTGWVTGLSSSIPLLLNTANNYMIKSGILNDTIPISYTLGSPLNIAMVLMALILSPILMLLLFPKKEKIIELNDMLEKADKEEEITIKEEANNQKLPFKATSDRLNNSILLQYAIAILGLIYIVYHFGTKGLDLNLNIMIFVFVILGMFLHQTPIRYGISMKRASTNVSGLLFQFPFYAGIMGIMLDAGLGEKLADVIASTATINTYPFFAYITGGIVNFAIPSAGGEFAVIGTSIINAVKEIGAGLPEAEVTAMVSRAALSIAYGESLSNLLQPFYLLMVLPVMGAGIKIQARDIMGYLVIPFLIYFVIQCMLVVWMPL